MLDLTACPTLGAKFFAFQQNKPPTKKDNRNQHAAQVLKLLPTPQNK